MMAVKPLGEAIRAPYAFSVIVVSQLVLFNVSIEGVNGKIA